MEGQCAAYWTTLAPNVEEYSGSAARFIASGSGHVIKGILWCGDVTMERLEWGNKVMKKRMASGSRATEISPETLKRIKRCVCYTAIYIILYCYAFCPKTKISIMLTNVIFQKQTYPFIYANVKYVQL